MRFPVFTLFEITASVPSPLSETAEVFLPETLEPKAVFWTLWGLPFRLKLVFARENSSEAAKESQFFVMMVLYDPRQFTGSYYVLLCIFHTILILPHTKHRC